MEVIYESADDICAYCGKLKNENGECECPDSWKKNTHGGAGRGQGNHQKYNEPTKTIAFRCPASKVPEMKVMVKTMLSKWKVKSSNPPNG